MAGRQAGSHTGQGAAIAKGDELFDDGVDALRVDLPERGLDGGVGGQRGGLRLCAAWYGDGDGKDGGRGER